MKITPVFLFLLFGLAANSAINSNTPDSATSAFIFSTQKLMFNDKFEAADSLCEIFIKSHSSSPVGYLFKAGTLLGEMSDREEVFDAPKFRNLIDTVIRLCDNNLPVSAGTDAAYLYLWRGHAHVYRSLFESQFGSLTSAIKHGFRAADDYQTGLKQDSTLYDLYFGLGNYHYWKSVKAGILRTIGIISNDIAKGIQELARAADSGYYFSEPARNSMIWIRLDKNEYDSAIALANETLLKYPDSRTLRWPLAMAYYKGEKFEKAAEMYQYIREYFDQNRGNYFNLIECDYQIYTCCRKLGWDSQADEILVAVNEYRSNVPRGTQRRQLAKLNYLRRELAR